MGAVWAYDFFFLFFGPEMTQTERNEEAEAALHYERLRKEGMNMEEIGLARARGDFEVGDADDAIDVEPKAGTAEHIETRAA
jgi:SHS family lactate transporter-like MFS transporter